MYICTWGTHALQTCAIDRMCNACDCTWRMRNVCVKCVWFGCETSTRDTFCLRDSVGSHDIHYVHWPCFIEGGVGPHLVLLIGIHLDIARVHTESTQSTITAHIVLVLKHPLLVENAHSFHPGERERRVRQTPKCTQVLTETQVVPSQDYPCQS